MEAKGIWRGVWSLFLCFILAAPFAGCGGGGSSSSSPSTPGSVSGVVADGYLIGATVFSDRDGDKKWDEGEPKTVTEDGGRYTLEGEELDKHPIVVIVDVDVVDEDTGAAVGKKYILSAPADKPEFISPLTTLAQQQMEQNPALTSEQAEKVITKQAGAGEGVSIFRDYVAEKESNSDYESLHKVARVVAASLGEMQETVEAAAAEAGYDTEEVFDALVQIVTNRVMEKLTDIAVAVDETAPESFDAGTIATDLATQAETEEPIAETIADKIEEAETPVVVSSFKTLLESGGTYWLWYDYDDGWQDLEYGTVTLGADGRLAEDPYEYDFETQQWVPGYQDGDYYLTPDGWVWDSDSAEEGTITFNSDGTAVWTSTIDGAQIKISAVEIDLAGKKMSAFAGRVGELLADPDAVFPAGAKALKPTFVDLDDSYEVKVWKDSETDPDHNVVRYWDGSGEHAVATVAEMRSHFAKGTGNYHYFEHWLVQFDADGNVYVYDDDTSPYTLVETGTWTEETINNQKAMMLHLSEMVRLRGDIDGVPFFIEWEGGLVKQGEYDPAGNVDVDDYEFNKTAFEALKGNLNLGSDKGSDQFNVADLEGKWAVIVIDGNETEVINFTIDANGTIISTNGDNFQDGSCNIKTNGEVTCTSFWETQRYKFVMTGNMSLDKNSVQGTYTEEDPSYLPSGTFSMEK